MIGKWEDMLRNNAAGQRIWRFVRQKRIIRQHQLVHRFWKPIMDDYFDGKLPTYSMAAKLDLPVNKIIWQYWGQGLKDPNLPEVVRLSFASVDKFKGDYLVIRLDDENIQEYIDIPDFVQIKKRKNKQFNRTFFSDLLRLALLKTYGGIWLDATTLLTGALPDKYKKLNFFVYQRDINEANKKYWETSYAFYWNWHAKFRVRMLTSFIFAKQGDHMISLLLDLILYFWKTQDHIVDYFFFQIAYDMLVREYGVETCAIVSDVYPHLLQTKINNPANDFVSYESALKATTIHKMTYYKKGALQRFKDFVYSTVLIEDLNP